MDNQRDKEEQASPWMNDQRAKAWQEALKRTSLPAV
jgi:hypothetical protein